MQEDLAGRDHLWETITVKLLKFGRAAPGKRPECVSSQSIWKVSAQVSTTQCVFLQGSFAYADWESNYFRHCNNCESRAAAHCVQQKLPPQKRWEKELLICWDSSSHLGSKEMLLSESDLAPTSEQQEKFFCKSSSKVDRKVFSHLIFFCMYFLSRQHSVTCRGCIA